MYDQLRPEIHIERLEQDVVALRRQNSAFRQLLKEVTPESGGVGLYCLPITLHEAIKEVLNEEVL